MPLRGSYRLGPDNATLSVKTGRSGAAAKAGHDLVLELTSWSAALELAEDPAQSSVSLSADGRSLRVRAGTGGMKALDEDDKDSIRKTIDDDVLHGKGIEFRSTQVAADGDRISVRGDLTLVGNSRPIAFELLTADDGSLSGRAVVSQSVWGIKPYSALFGALKVADDVEVTLDARAP